MANKVIDVEKSEGEFTDPRTGKNVAYNNIKIHFIKPNPGKYSDGNFGSGMLPVTVKIQNEKEIVEAVFGGPITKDDLLSMVDHEYEFFFNEKGQIERITAPLPPAIKKGS